jgi:hypothetical protein
MLAFPLFIWLKLRKYGFFVVIYIKTKIIHIKLMFP